MLLLLQQVSTYITALAVARGRSVTGSTIIVALGANRLIGEAVNLLDVTSITVLDAGHRLCEDEVITTSDTRAGCEDAELACSITGQAVTSSLLHVEALEA